MKRKILSFLLVACILISMIPTFALATTAPTIYVDTTEVGELKAGDTFTASIKIKDNPGICLAYLEIGIPDVLTYVSCTNDSGAATCSYANGNIAWEYDSDFAADYTEDGSLFTLSFTVNEDVSAGEYEITVGLLNGVEENLGDVDENNVAATFVSGTITIAGEAASALSFTDGKTSYSYDELVTICANGSLESPGDNYYFAGWFSGLAGVSGITQDDEGRYILDSTTADGTEFALTECRPRYDEQPTEGAYNALWLYDDSGKATNAILEVYNSGKVVYRYTSDEDVDALPTLNQTMLTAAFTAVDDDGYVKLLTDLEMTGASAISIAYSINLDLNGHTVNDQKGLTTTSGTTSSIESSYGDGTFELPSSGSILSVNDGVDETVVSVLRDFEATGESSIYFTFTSNAVVKLIENVKLTDTTYGTAIQMYNNAKIQEISNCEFTAAYWISITGATTVVVENIHDCTMTNTSTRVPLLVNVVDSVSLTFGPNNKLSAVNAAELFGVDGGFAGEYTVTFTEEAVKDDADDYLYECASPGIVIADSVSVDMPAGYNIMLSNDGTKTVVTFVTDGGKTVTWYENNVGGQEPVELVTYCFDSSLAVPAVEQTVTIGIATYTFVGWATEYIAPAESIDESKLYDLSVIPETSASFYAVYKMEITGGTPNFHVDMTVAGTKYGGYFETIIDFNTFMANTFGQGTHSYEMWSDVSEITVTVLQDAVIDYALGVYNQNNDAGGMRLFNGTATYDLNGHTVTIATDNQRGLFWADQQNTSNANYVITSSNGTGTITNAGARARNYIVSLGFNCSYDGTNTTTLTVSNVKIDMELSPTGTAGGNSDAMMQIFGAYGENYISNVTVNFDNVTIDAPNTNCLVYMNCSGDLGNVTLNVNVTDSTLSYGTTLAYSAKKDTGYTKNTLTVTMDADSKIKNAAGTQPYLDIYPITCTDATQTEMTVANGWYSFEKKLVIGGSAVEDTENHEVEIAEGETSIEITNPDLLADLESLTVTGSNAVLEFQSDALKSIAGSADGKANISVQESTDATTVTGAVVRYDFEVTDSNGDPIGFQGPVKVKIPFEPGEGKDAKHYRAYHIYTDSEGDHKVPVDTVISEVDGTYYATFTIPHFSSAEIAPVAEDGYIAGLNSTTTDVYTGNEVIVNVGVSYADDTRTGFNAAEIVVTYPTNLLTLDTDKLDELVKAGTLAGYTDKDGTLTIEVFGGLKTFDTANFVLNFTANAKGTATVELTNAAFAHGDYVHYDDARGDLQDATINPSAVEINIGVETVKVTLPEDTSVNGATETEKNAAYSFTITQDAYYDYVVKATIGGTEYTLLGDAGENNVYTYTIDADKVTDDITIEYTRTAQKFDVTITDADGNSSTTEDGAEYNKDYTFNVPVKAQWQYSYEITIGTEKYTGASDTTVDGTRTVTIPGTAITGDITITITGEQTEFNVTYEGSDATITDSDDEGTGFSKGEAVTIAVNPQEGYTYTVAIDTNGDGVADEVLEGEKQDDGTIVYTYEDIQSDITVIVTKTLNGTVNVYTYLTLDAAESNSKIMFLVTYTNEDLADGYVPYYGADETNPMLWSEKYQAYCWLVIVEGGTLSVDDATVQVRIDTSETKATVNYSMDINGTNKIDAADAQFVYNMYNAKYDSFTTVGIAKFLAADQNGDATTKTETDNAINVDDAAAIIIAILAGTAE